MLNIANLATASLSQLKSFASEHGINPVGDKRLLTTWRDAIQDFFAATAKEVSVLTQETIEGATQCVRETLTYDNAVAAANFTNVVVRKSAKFTVKAVWNTFLVALALGMLAIDAYKNRDQIKVDVLYFCIKTKSRLRSDLVGFVNVWRYRARYQYSFLQSYGSSIFRQNVIKPAVSYRDRIRAIVAK